MACDAYAKLSGRMAAACVTSGPGATNAITGVMGAFQDSIPMIVISGQVRYEMEKAIDIAMSGRRGPVWIDVPLDIQSALVDVDSLVVYKDNMCEKKQLTLEHVWISLKC